VNKSFKALNEDAMRRFPSRACPALTSAPRRGGGPATDGHPLRKIAGARAARRRGRERATHTMHAMDKHMPQNAAPAQAAAPGAHRLHAAARRPGRAIPKCRPHAGLAAS